MPRILAGIVILLCCSATASSAQNFSTEEWDKISLNIVNLIADNKRLIKDATIDKESLRAMEKGRQVLEKAINECQTAMGKEREITAKDQELLAIANQTVKDLKKEIKKQKFLKWLGYVWGALATVAFVVVAVK